MEQGPPWRVSEMDACATLPHFLPINAEVRFSRELPDRPRTQWMTIAIIRI